MFFPGRSDLLIHGLNRRHGACDVPKRLTRLATQLDAAVSQRPARIERGHHLLSAALKRGDQYFDFFGGFLSALRQATNFVRHDGKPTSCLAGTGRFDRRIEGQQISLLRDRLDHVEHAADLVALQLELAHGLGRIVDLQCEAFDLRDGVVDHFVTVARLLIGMPRCLAGFLCVARHFHDRRGHLVHCGRHAVGFVFLAVHAHAGLLCHRRQLLRRAGYLRNAITDAGDELAQAHGHFLHAPLQHAHFVASADFQVLTQITVGDARCCTQREPQRRNDLLSNQPGRQQSQEYCQPGHGAQRLARLSGLGIAPLALQRNDLPGGRQQALAQRLHDFLGRLHLDLQIFEQTHVLTVLEQRLARFEQPADIAVSLITGDLFYLLQCFIDGGHGGDFVGLFAAEHVRLNLIASVLHLPPQLLQVGELVQTLTAVLLLADCLQDFAFNLADGGDCLFGELSQLRPSVRSRS